MRTPYEEERSYYAQGQVESLNEYMTRTFLWMVLGLMITFGLAVLGWMTNATLWLLYHVPGFHLIVLVVTLIMAFTMVSRIERMSVDAARGVFPAYSVLFGFTMSCYLYLYELPSLIFVFLATAVYFAALSAYGWLTHRDLSSIGSILTVGLIFLIICGVILLFAPGLVMLDRLVCIAGIAIFLAFTAYDTQKIRAMYNYYAGYPDMLEKASVFSALQLYLDFLNLFLYLLRYVGKRRN